MSNSNQKSFTLSYTDFVYHKIQQMILSKELTAGEKLSYGKFEKMLGVSKTPVIIALSCLETKGFVNYYKNRGYFVSKNTLKELQKIADEESEEKGAGDIFTGEDIPASVNSLAPPLNMVLYEKIKEMISSFSVEPGQKLAYSDLEKKFGVSKTPIVNALSKLESEGYVYIKKNVGCFVKDANPRELKEVMEARACLEISNIDLIIKNFSAEEFEKLEEVHSRYCEYKTDIYDHKKRTTNAEFHVQLVKIGQNQFMAKYIENIYEWLELRVRQDVFPSHRIKQAEIEHCEIMDALRVQDAVKLKSALQNHLMATLNIHQSFSAQKSSDVSANDMKAFVA